MCGVHDRGLGEGLERSLEQEHDRDRASQGSDKAFRVKRRARDLGGGELVVGGRGVRLRLLRGVHHLREGAARGRWGRGKSVSGHLKASQKHRPTSCMCVTPILAGHTPGRRRR
jgi:hypothetical protein